MLIFEGIEVLNGNIEAFPADEEKTIFQIGFGIVEIFAALRVFPEGSRAVVFACLEVIGESPFVEDLGFCLDSTTEQGEVDDVECDAGFLKGIGKGRPAIRG